MKYKKKYNSRTAKETREIIADLARRVRPGTVVTLLGDLGVGKTTSVGAFLTAWGLEGPFTSPTFTLVEEYNLLEEGGSIMQGLERIYHIDAYRIATEDARRIGLQEMVADLHAITLIEWANNISEILPEEHLEIQFQHGGGDLREITIVGDANCLILG